MRITYFKGYYMPQSPHPSLTTVGYPGYKNIPKAIWQKECWLVFPNPNTGVRM